MRCDEPEELVHESRHSTISVLEVLNQVNSGTVFDHAVVDTEEGRARART